MDSEKKDIENHSFVLNEVVKKKILDMYNISEKGIPPKNESENPKNNDNQDQ